MSEGPRIEPPCYGRFLRAVHVWPERERTRDLSRRYRQIDSDVRPGDGDNLQPGGTKPSRDRDSNGRPIGYQPGGEGLPPGSGPDPGLTSAVNDLRGCFPRQ
jgi:hypothetical protein